MEINELNMDFIKISELLINTNQIKYIKILGNHIRISLLDNSLAVSGNFDIEFANDDDAVYKYEQIVKQIKGKGKLIEIK